MLQNASDFHKELLNKFSYHPTIKQSKLFYLLVEFLFSKNERSLFLLKGYAGTGKTTTISTLVSSLWKINKKSVLFSYRKSSKSNLCIFKKTSFYNP